MPPVIENIIHKEGSKYEVSITPHQQRPGEGKLWQYPDQLSTDGLELAVWISEDGDTVVLVVEVEAGKWLEATQEGQEPSPRRDVPVVLP